jgi:hypothetical protein
MHTFLAVKGFSGDARSARLMGHKELITKRKGLGGALPGEEKPLSARHVT